jgi:alpha-ketoglutarate-dependent taurine dioxygenase
MATVRFTPLHPSLGAEVTGVDLSKPIDASTREALERGLADHLALVIRDQSLTPAQYLAAAATFGPPMEQHYSQHHMPDFPLIGLIWHRNGQRPAEPGTRTTPTASAPRPRPSLYGVEIPSAGGGTSVANMRAAYLACPRRNAGASNRSRRSTAWTAITPTPVRRIGQSTGGPSSTPWCAPIPCTGHGRSISTSPKPPTSEA